MRAASRVALLLAGLLMAGPAPAQQPSEAAVPRETLPQPRFAPMSESSTIEVTPLAPPTGDDGQEDDAAVTVPQRSWGGRGDDAVESGRPAWRRPGEGRFGKPARPTPRIPLGPAVPVELPPTELRAGARLRQLDKMTGQTDTFELAVGDAREVGRMRIRLEACRSPADNGLHGTVAFLKAWDTKEPDDEVFSGWMFAESPALSAVDHPRYDLWVISCTTSALAVSGPSE